jgi:hypothetical protein
MSPLIAMRGSGAAGPLVLQAELPQELVLSFNRMAERVTRSDSAMKAHDWSGQLSGNHRGEFRITDLLLSNFEAQKFLLEISRSFVERAPNRFMNVKRAESVRDKVVRNVIQEAWINEMVAGDFNPVHHHPHCDISCVGFLEIPVGYDDELATLSPHKRVAGFLQFIDGRPAFGNDPIWQVKPRVGEFYMFPSWLLHCVYPFRSPGVRRSFSANLMLAVGDGHP